MVLYCFHIACVTAIARVSLASYDAIYMLCGLYSVHSFSICVLICCVSSEREREVRGDDKCPPLVLGRDPSKPRVSATNIHIIIQFIVRFLESR